jgi:hypothetical protein
MVGDLARQWSGIWQDILEAGKIYSPFYASPSQIRHYSVIGIQKSKLRGSGFSVIGIQKSKMKAAAGSMEHREGQG